MGKTPATVLLLVAMIAVIITTDVLFFRGQAWTWERFATNTGIVLLFGAFCFRFIGRS